MAAESNLQTRVIEYLESKGAYIQNKLGTMTSAPGQADLTICYRGLFIVIELKVDDNKPNRKQGIHCRKVQKAGGITAICWTLEEVKKLIYVIDEYQLGCYAMAFIKIVYQQEFDKELNDGTSY